jgi:hypothetical protein
LLSKVLCALCEDINVILLYLFCPPCNMSPPLNI